MTARSLPSLGRPSQRIAVCVVFVSAMFMNIMDITIVNVALPAMSRELHVVGTGISAVSIAYVVTIAVVIPLSGWLGDRYGHRRILLTAIAVFTVASVLCGLAQNLGELVGFRVLQGVGSGLMTPVGMALLYRTFPPAERVRVSSILTVPTLLAPASGPVVGGILVTELSWRWVFFVNLPLGALALAFGLVFLRGEPGEATGPFDLVGFGSAAVGLAALMYGLSEGPHDGWGSTVIVGAIVVGVALLGMLIVTQLRTADPLLNLRLFRDRLFRSGIAVTGLGALVFFGFLFVLALFLQDGLGMSPIESGLSTIPEALGVMLGSQLVSRFLYRRFGPRPLMAFGCCGEAITLILLTTIDSLGQAWTLRTYVFFMGYFMSHVMIPSQVATMARVRRASTGAASTLFNVARQVSGATGVAVLATVLSAVGTTSVAAGRTVPHLTAYHVAFGVAAGLALLGAGAALTVRNADADVTRSRARVEEPASA